MPNVSDRPRFFVDSMLGNIARKLRLFGYDSRYDSGIDDEELIRTAKDETRIIVTKDRQLADRCRRLGHDSILISKTGDIEQVREVREHLHIGCMEINGDVARCPKCNSATIPFERQDLLGVLPAGVLELYERFWRCGKCSQVYWEGTHIKNLQRFVGEVNGTSLS